MDIKGKINVFPRDVESSEGVKGKVFETSLGHKNEEGKYVDSMTIRVIFSSKIMSEEAKKKYESDKYYSFEVEGFLSTRSYTQKDGKKRTEPVYYILKAKRTSNGTPYQRKTQVEEKPLDENAEDFPL